jgi:3-deoxy-D-manno-oct-2-ulosonic acid (Kdo) hydroxylase
MPRITTVSHDGWTAAPATDLKATAAAELERGAVLFFERLPFAIEERERAIFSPNVLATSKNVSFDPGSGRLSGTVLTGTDYDALRDLIARFSDQAASFLDALLPEYKGSLRRARASFRPAEIAGRASSWRKDDSRLHVDSFPASPVGDRRILRLFTNVNPNGRPRSWRVGDEFAQVARRFASALELPLPGSGAILRLLRVTKTHRSAYDALMLQLHDHMKKDAMFQARSPQTAVEFPPGATWLAFTDEVSHAAMAGQYQLEQTFLLPVATMREPERSPLRILEGIKGRKLV